MHVTLRVKDFRNKIGTVCLVRKREKYIDYLKYIVACLCSSTTEILKYSLSMHLFCGRFLLLTLPCQMVTKGRTHLYNPAVKRCRFAWRSGTTRHEKADKIHAHGYPLGPATNY